jgi:hypothetical protein
MHTSLSPPEERLGLQYEGVRIKTARKETCSVTRTRWLWQKLADTNEFQVAENQKATVIGS